MSDEGRHVGLIVEDDLEMAAELKELFESYDYGCLHAATVDEAMTLVERGGFCFALFDVQLKMSADSIKARVESGIRLFSFFREHFPRRNDDDKHIVQAIAMSGHAKDRLDAVKLLQLGANDFFAKPFAENEETLDSVIRRCLRKSGRTDHAHCADLNRLAMSGAARRSSAPPGPPAALLFTHEHQGMPLSVNDVNGVVAKRHEYDLFLNVVTPGGDGYLAGRKDGNGAYADVTLTQLAAAAIAELVTAKKPVRANALKCVRQGGIASPVRIIERARTALDVRTGRTAWRAFRTITHVGGDDSTKEFFFDPPQGFRYAVIQGVGR